MTVLPAATTRVLTEAPTLPPTALEAGRRGALHKAADDLPEALLSVPAFAWAPAHDLGATLVSGAASHPLLLASSAVLCAALAKARSAKARSARAHSGKARPAPARARGARRPEVSLGPNPQRPRQPGDREPSRKGGLRTRTRAALARPD